MRWEELSPKACEDAQSKRIGLYPALPSNEKQPLFIIAMNQPLMQRSLINSLNICYYLCCTSDYIVTLTETVEAALKFI